jgi:uncharacterized membrane protein
MSATHRHAGPCQVCGAQKAARELRPGAAVREGIAALIRKDHPEWDPSQPICEDCLEEYRAKYVEQVLEEEKGELTSLERDVLHSLQSGELLASDTNADFDQKLTLGQHVADKVAEFGGSWAFIFAFLFVMFAWITLNSVALLQRHFDPFPFILLNLVLSCLAAIQAPVIMMSQNRQEAKDRLRAEHDYQVNLKAEMEIRNLHDKLDHLLTHQWERLAEIQQVQLDILQQLAAREGKAR